MIKPHGKILVKNIVSKEKELPDKKLVIHDDFVYDVIDIGCGIYSPLTGFLPEKEYQSVLHEKRLTDGTPWTIPIILPVEEEKSKEFSIDSEILLCDKKGRKIGILHLHEKYKFNKEEFARCVFQTVDVRHPGVARLAEYGDVIFAGEVKIFEDFKDLLGEFKKYFYTPEETRSEFSKRSWEQVVGFQTRNAPHMGHEFLQKTALSFLDGLFINPVIGRKKKGDFKDDVILKSYEILIKNYYPEDRVFLGILPMQMRYAGPLEAIHHAIIRKNFGCTHILIGRDHAGVGNFYHPFAAHEIFKDFPDLEIQPIFFTTFFYCKKCKSIMNEKTCPHKDDRIYFSGTKIREMFQQGKCPPEEIFRPEVAEFIMKYDNPFVE